MGTLYERIQGLSKAKGVSVSRMCIELGLSKSTMSDLKNGRTKSLSTPTAQKIAEYFDVSLGYLLAEETEKTPAGAGGRTVSVEDIKFALFGGRGEITDEMYNEVRSFAEYVAQREEKKEKTALLFSQPRPDQDLRVASPVILPTARKKDEE